MVGVNMETNPEVETALLSAIARNADHNAFEKLYARMQRPAYSLAMHITGNPAWAEDAIQEGMLRVWKHAHTFRIHEKPRSWILRIVARESLRIREKMQATATRQRETEKWLPPKKDTQAPASEQDEMLKALNSSLRRMPEATRRILALRFGAELTQDDIASALKIPQRTVSNRLKTALDALRSELSKAGLASIVTLEAAMLREALLQQYDAPVDLTASVLEQLKGTENGDRATLTAAGQTRISVGILCVAAFVVAAGTVAWRAQQPAPKPPAMESKKPTPWAIASKNENVIPVGGSMEPYHQKWSFDKQGDVKGLKALAGGWVHGFDKGDQDRGCMKIGRDLYLQLDVHQQQLPVRIKGMIKCLNKNGRLRVNSFWNGSERSVEFSRIFPKGTILLRQTALSWQPFELMVGKFFSTFRYMDKLCHARLVSPTKGARIWLGFESPVLLDDLQIDTIAAAEFPDTQSYLDCVNAIPVEKHQGKLRIEKAASPMNYDVELKFIGITQVTLSPTRKPDAPILRRDK